MTPISRLFAQLGLSFVSVLTVSCVQTEKPLDSTQELAARPTLAKRVEASDSLHGVVVQDPYRWLEDSQSEETKAFISAQNAFARASLDRMP